MINIFGEFWRMMMKVTFAHTNLVAKDWVSLAQFYVEVFQCELKLSERDISGD
jgi:predicted enzyme related to lactoylglutathione lyase